MYRTRIKFCGITREQDMQQAVVLGVDAVGLVFANNSPRAVNVQQACTLINHCGPLVTRIGLFMDQDASTISHILDQVPLDMLQFHGSETEQFCTSFGMPYLKSVAMGTAGNVERDRTMTVESANIDYASASALLLDSNALGQPGGSGETFDWSKVPEINQPIIIAGGLDASNVSDVVTQLKPYAVDVSSGIESAKGKKDINKMRDFVESVRVANER